MTIDSLEHFNDDDLFCAAVGGTLKLKQRVIDLAPPAEGGAIADVTCDRPAVV